MRSKQRNSLSHNPVLDVFWLEVRKGYGAQLIHTVEMLLQLLKCFLETLVGLNRCLITKVLLSVIAQGYLEQGHVKFIRTLPFIITLDII